MTLPFYPFYWSDYSGKCFHLTQGQHGAYFMLMRFIYTTGKPIPHEQRYSIATALLEQEQQNTDTVLGQFFRRDGDFWHNDRVTEIITEAHEAHEKRRNAGKKGGQAKLKQCSSNAQAPIPKPITKSLELKPQTPLPVDNSVDGSMGFKNDKGGMGRKQPVDKSVYLDIGLYLNEKALERAKKAAPGWDIYALISKYNEGSEARGIPDNPPGAFIAWCGKYTKGKAPG
jgi:uncharacterized protein YdaU (DUF1376 family)